VPKSLEAPHANTSKRKSRLDADIGKKGSAFSPTVEGKKEKKIMARLTCPYGGGKGPVSSPMKENRPHFLLKKAPDLFGRKAKRS